VTEDNIPSTQKGKMQHLMRNASPKLASRLAVLSALYLLALLLLSSREQHGPLRNRGSRNGVHERPSSLPTFLFTDAATWTLPSGAVLMDGPGLLVASLNVSGPIWMGPPGAAVDLAQALS